MRLAWTAFVLVALVATGPAIAPSIATGAIWVNVDPDDIQHGESEQTMDVFVEGVSGSTEIVLNVTPLATEGVDLSGAAVETEDPVGTSIDANLDRTGDTELVRVSIDPDADGATDVSFQLTLTGLETAEASHTRLDYGIDYDGGQRQSQTFELADPALPWVSPLTRTEDLITGESNASQRTSVHLDEVPAAEAATVRVDLSALTARNVSLSAAEVTARLTYPDQGAVLEGVERNGGTVEFSLRTATETDVTIEFTLHGLDTRNAEPASDLRYTIEFEGAAGTTADSASPFGLYRPGETPTATPLPTDGLTTTAPPANEGTGTAEEPPVGPAPGFGAAAAVLALLLVAAWFRTS